MYNITSTIIPLVTLTVMKHAKENYDSNTSSNSDACQGYRETKELVKLILIVFGFLANVFSIVATLNVPRERWSQYNTLIVNLGVSDIMVVLSCVIHDILMLKKCHHHCTPVLRRMFLNIALTSTLFNLVLMAVDHYVAIMQALYYDRFFSKQKVRIIIAALWATSVFCGVLDLFVSLPSFRKEDTTFCDHVNTVNRTTFNYELVIVIFIFIVLVGLLIIYTRICYQVRKLVRDDRHNQLESSHSMKAIVTTFLIIGTFALCWCPIGLYHTVLYILRPDYSKMTKAALDRLRLVNSILFLFIILNTICDPVIYAVRRSEVKLGYIRVYNRLLRKRRRSSLYENELHSHFRRRNDSRDTGNAENTIVTRLSISDKITSTCTSHCTSPTDSSEHSKYGFEKEIFSDR
ncbi:melanocyte-stimulating hormone receptor-like [Mya arenaria]|uniref:melanocyte-stimulating hormone receptor-like n=1 Tax=Mya arenaria TaxID=6604 RepID=UPI0022E7D1B4|nr:melanocyte-stimulating hormone receptor-like [Mya arenaria]XP_052764824.1 melanocyte-stimulating hormone receptor-like [Mya arenaria]XP_052764825.1 melanocyte-stimulating hormone receptor-like [Mya arenaria]